jgi:hypothetical protein
MSVTKVIEILSKNKAVFIDGIGYALIDGRLYNVIFNEKVTVKTPEKENGKFPFTTPDIGGLDDLELAEQIDPHEPIELEIEIYDGLAIEETEIIENEPEQEITVSYTDCNLPFNEFAVYCERNDRVIRDLPEVKSVLSADGLYNFAMIPSHECPKCLSYVNVDNAYRHGRFAYCYHCFRCCYKAPRLDGVRDDEPIRKKKEHIERKKKEPEKPKVIDVEEALANAKPITRKLKLSL